MDAVERMYQVLVKTIRANHPAHVGSPFTVGELHQQILPFRHFRRELGLETNQEYELVMMELLTGARGYLHVDDRLRDGLSRELQSGSPDPSRIRDFADAQVSLNQQALGGVAESAATIATRLSTPRSSSPLPDQSRCRYCGGELPEGRDVRFCPQCGQNLQVRNCPACGGEIDENWKFCVSCGKAIT